MLVLVFPLRLSLAEEIFQNGPQRSKARALGAAERTLDGEDRSETLG
jgi:hypothetical protein